MINKINIQAIALILVLTIGSAQAFGPGSRDYIGI